MDDKAPSSGDGNAPESPSPLGYDRPSHGDRLEGAGAAWPSESLGHPRPSFSSLLRKKVVKLGKLEILAEGFDKATGATCPLVES